MNNEQLTRGILAMLQADARKEVSWKITYRHQVGKRQAIGYKIVWAESREDAIYRADMWRPLILKVEQL
jgi:tRNA A37 N6-isopentenylltransferase MiaA